MVINSLPNENTGLIPFFLNHGHELVTLIQMMKGNEEIKIKSVASFARRITSD